MQFVGHRDRIGGHHGRARGHLEGVTQALFGLEADDGAHRLQHHALGKAQPHTQQPARLIEGGAVELHVHVAHDVAMAVADHAGAGRQRIGRPGTFDRRLGQTLGDVVGKGGMNAVRILGHHLDDAAGENIAHQRIRELRGKADALFDRHRGQPHPPGLADRRRPLHLDGRGQDLERQPLLRHGMAAETGRRQRHHHTIGEAVGDRRGAHPTAGIGLGRHHHTAAAFDRFEADIRAGDHLLIRLIVHLHSWTSSGRACRCRTARRGARTVRRAHVMIPRGAGARAPPSRFAKWLDMCKTCRTRPPHPGRRITRHTGWHATAGGFQPFAQGR